jgi:hypothetical protein
MSTAPNVNEPPNVNPVTKLGGCLVEEEIPPEWLEETTMSTAPDVNEPPNPVVAHAPEPQYLQVLKRSSAANLRNVTGHGRPTPSLGHPQSSPGRLV